MKLAGVEAARAMRGTLEGTRGAATGVSIDTRTLTPGDLFFAIRGSVHDGHAFLAEAFRRGASGAVVERAGRAAAEIPRDGFLIRVPDTTLALGALARAERLKSGARIVAITGSLGKTTTKEAAAAAIGAARSVFRSRGNLNNQWGLPLSLLSREDQEVGVVELGMSAPGEIRTLTGIAVPDCGLVTNIAEAHLEFFGSIEGIAEAKGELYEALPAGATALVNADDERVVTQAKRFGGRRVTYGFGKGADVRGCDYDPLGPGVRFAVRAFGGPAVRVSCLLRGRHNASNVLAALAAAVVTEGPLDRAASGLESLGPLPGRGRRAELANGAVLVDDTYNASPRALKAMVRELSAEPARRRILIVGDMRELGPEAERMHRECGSFASQRNLDLVIGVGRLGRVVARTFRETGRPGRLASDPVHAAEILLRESRPGDLVLVKGSRAVGMERTVQALRAGSGEGA